MIPSQEIRILSIEDAAKSWKARFGQTGKGFVVIGNIKTAHEAYCKGFEYPELMVGCLKDTAGGEPVRNPIIMAEEEQKLLDEPKSKGCKVELQDFPIEYGY